MPKTTTHILIECNFVEVVWNIVVAKFALPNYGCLGSAGSSRDLVTKITVRGSKKEKRKNLGILATFWWIIWKEWNKSL
jgi:hypothetical protein